MTMRLSITRVVNACVLLELEEGAVLTDPYFEDRWFLRLRESIGVRPALLPRLCAILGGHGVFDHWQPASLEDYSFKGETPVLVATRAMQRKALAAGFPDTQVLQWGTTRALSSGLTLEVVPAQKTAGMRVNSYVLMTNQLRIFVGTEARDLEPLRRYRREHPAVDVALLPIDASRVLGRKLVMGPEEAVEASQILGARILIPIHYALEPVPLLLQTMSDCEQRLQMHGERAGLRIMALETGQTWRAPPW